MNQSKMKILYINCDTDDYLSDSLLIGLKGLPNVTILEYTQNFYIYKSKALKEDSNLIRGHGFTLYNLLEKEMPKNELEIIKNFDLIIFGSIHRQYGLFLQFYPQLTHQNTWIFDSEDGPNLFPYSGYFLKKPYFLFCPRPHHRFLYFKREWINAETLHYCYYKILPKFVCRHLPLIKNLRPISFSIPKSKVFQEEAVKTKLFPKHIVDEEIVAQTEGSFSSYAFSDEAAYYKDLQTSKFGITTKRGGWDCLRHYEIAANAAVICFKNLNEKPATCAPHGLIDGVNCLSYSSYNHLMQRIDALSEKDYRSLLDNTKKWINQNTCEYKAQELIDNFGPFSVKK
jgi:hypothetical protein